MIIKAMIFLVALLVTIIGIYASNNDQDDVKHDGILLVGGISQHHHHHHVNNPQMNMTLCVDKCAGKDCKSYVTPISTCYSSSELFPNDPTWSGKDLRDDVICQTLVRTIFETENSTCLGDKDTFEIPLNECVGPFGKPRPWGSFSLIQGQNINHDVFRSSLCEMNVLKTSAATN